MKRKRMRPESAIQSDLLLLVEQHLKPLRGALQSLQRELEQLPRYREAKAAHDREAAKVDPEKYPDSSVAYRIWWAIEESHDPVDGMMHRFTTSAEETDEYVSALTEWLRRRKDAVAPHLHDYYREACDSFDATNPRPQPPTSRPTKAVV